MKIKLKTYFFTYLLSNLLFALTYIIYPDSDKLAGVAMQLGINGAVWGIYSLIRLLVANGVK